MKQKSREKKDGALLLAGLYCIYARIKSMKITLKRGNDRNLKLTVTKAGAAVDVTGWTVRLTVKRNPTDSDADAVLSKIVSTIPNPTLGIINVPIAAADTESKDVGTYSFDVLVVDNAGKKQNSDTGEFIIAQEITDEVS